MRNHPRQSAAPGGGAGGEAPAGGLGAEPPYWPNNTFLFGRKNENTNKKIQKIHSKKNMQDLIKIHEK